MNTYRVDEIQTGSYFSKDLSLDDKFVLVIPELPVSQTIKNLLTQWNFETVCSDGENIAAFQGEISKSKAAYDLLQTKERDKLSEAKRKQDEIIAKVETKYKNFLSGISKIHETAKRGMNLNPRAVADVAKELTDFVLEKKKLILLIPAERFSEIYDYLVLHELRSTVFAIIIGNYLKMPVYKLIELATACLVHEIGMVRIPSSVYNSTDALSLKEKQALLTHPIISYNIVNTSGFSLPICLACLEHHERENGAGYPRRLTSKKISLLGKIIAVACSYEATTSSRPYRDAKNPTTSIMEIIKNENKQYDDTILKALLYSVSFFPIGMHVVLSDGRLARVVDVNPDDPRYPIVQILDEVTKDGSPRIVGTDKTDLYISRTLSKEEFELMRD